MKEYNFQLNLLLRDGNGDLKLITTLTPYIGNFKKVEMSAIRYVESRIDHLFQIT